MSKDKALFTAIESCTICEPEDWKDPLYSNQFKFQYEGAEAEPIVGMPYCFQTNDCSYYGVTDEAGLTGRVFTEKPEDIVVYVGKKAYHFYKTYQKNNGRKGVE